MTARIVAEYVLGFALAALLLWALAEFLKPGILS